MIGSGVLLHTLPQALNLISKVKELKKEEK